MEELNTSVIRVADQASENSANVKIAARYVGEANDNIKNGSEHMDRLAEAMGDIGSASDQIANITKVIEDITFQTNIPALNAAIEAARCISASVMV